VKKNDPILVLEAMKMENVIKAPGDAVVSAIASRERQGRGEGPTAGELLTELVVIALGSGAFRS
jgi:acetyl/propionyl-CoA carboxylase alpha subunit